jgi:hypothetical protein
MAKLRLKFILGVPFIVVTLVIILFLLFFAQSPIPFLTVMVEQSLIKGVSYSTGNCGGQSQIMCVSYEELQARISEDKKYRMNELETSSVQEGCRPRVISLDCDSFRGRVYKSIYPYTKKLHPNIAY